MKIGLNGSQVDSLRGLLGEVLENGHYSGSFLEDLKNIYEQIIEKEMAE
jgi:hypothetical protein